MGCCERRSQRLIMYDPSVFLPIAIILQVGSSVCADINFSRLIITLGYLAVLVLTNAAQDNARIQ